MYFFKYNHHHMLESTLTLSEITLAAPGQTGGVVACPPGLIPAPGQYWLAHAPALQEPLPTALFAARILPEGIHLAPPLPPAWTAGMPLAVRGPLGKGFHLPAMARSVALAALGGLPHRLLPLAELALQQDASVALYTPIVPRGLPDEVEVLPLDLLPEARAWADVLALDVPLARLPEVARLLGLKPFERLSCAAQALVHTPMPCGALAECGVCAEPTAHGWKLACKDGPVFDLNPLLEAP